LNLLEKRLHSWTPRAPSVSLEARLFPQANGSTDRRPHRAGAWHWLTPAMAVFLLGLFLYGNQAGLLHQFHPASSPSLLATAALSRPELSTYYADARHSENNALRNTFEWTNGNRSLSTAGPMAQTNSVIQ
jgi:hypothetical protein